MGNKPYRPYISLDAKTSKLQDITYLEALAMAPNRDQLLAQVMPNTEEWFFFHILHAQVTNNVKKEKRLMDELRKSHYLHTQRGLQMQLRYMLRLYDHGSSSNKKTVRDWLINDKLNIAYTHTKEYIAEAAAAANDSSSSNNPQFPTKLKESLIHGDKLLAKALKDESFGIGRFTPLAYNWLATQSLSDSQRSALLSAVNRPTLPGIVKLVHQDVSSSSFGHREIHRQLTLQQLVQLASHGSIISHRYEKDISYLIAVLEKKQPVEQLDLLDIKQQSAYFDELWEYASRTLTSAEFNPLKAFIYYHCLAFDRDNRTMDYTKFMEYLKFPWNIYPHEDRYADKSWDDRQKIQWVRFGHIQVGYLPSFNDDGELLKDYVDNYFARPDVDSIDFFKEWIQSSWLTIRLAETKLSLLDSKDDEKAREKWLGMLDASTISAIRERVEMAFDRRNKVHFDVKDSVKLSVYIKNVPSLVVKLYKINTRAYYRSHQAEVPAHITLDGLKAHEEVTYDYSAVSPLTRARREFTFASLADMRGVFIVEMVGNGKRIRALIRKGQITFLEHRSPLGHMFRLFDESATGVAGTLWLDGQTYSSDEKTGVILVPYSAVGRTGQPIILTNTAADFSTLAHFDHRTEVYTFSCGLYIDREALLQKSDAELILRPSLSLNGLPANLDWLTSTKLVITTTNDEGVKSSRTIDTIKFTNDRETIHTFSVPDNLRTISFQLTVTVAVKSTGSTQTMNVSRDWRINEIDDSSRMEDIHLRCDASGYYLCVLGKSGEARVGRVVFVRLHHAWLTQHEEVTLQTDVDGRITLGTLPSITRLGATLTATSQPVTCSWNLVADDAVVRDTVNAREGEVIRIPYKGVARRITQSDFSLLEYGANRTYRADHTLTHLTLTATATDLSVTIAALPAGEYSFSMRDSGAEARGSDTIIDIIVAAGATVMSDYVMEKTRFVQVKNNDTTPLQIVSATEIKAGGDIQIQLGDWTKNTRVHVISSHFYPEYQLFKEMGAMERSDLRQFPFGRMPCIYMGAVDMSDEHQYILDRQRAVKARGNMLERPSLLLSQRFVRDTNFAADPVLRKQQKFVDTTTEDVSRIHRNKQMMAGKKHKKKEKAYARRSSFDEGFADGDDSDGEGGEREEMELKSHGLMMDQQQMKRGGFGGIFGGKRQAAPVTRNHRGYGNVDTGGSYEDGLARGGASRSLEFLSEPSKRLFNLRPDEKTGVIRIPRQSIGANHSYITVVACDGVGATVFHRVQLAANPSAEVAVGESKETKEAKAGQLQLHQGYRDIRLFPGLAADGHFTEQQLISVLHTNDVLTIDDIKTSRVEAYDSLSDVYSLYKTLAGEYGQTASLLTKFEWLVNWSTFSDATKQAKYSEFACHELHLFLFFKDRSFFTAVVRPYLANKLQKQFMDQWLLGSDISVYLKPFAFHRLNALEQILLALRIPAAAPLVAQFAADRASLKVRDAVFHNKLFMTALNTRALDTDAAGSLVPKTTRNEETKATKDGADANLLDVIKSGHALKKATVAAASASISLGGLMMPASTTTASFAKLGKGAARKDAAPAQEVSLMMDHDDDDHDFGAASSEDEKDEEAEESFDSLAQTMERSQLAAPRLYQSPPTTKEYEERGYYDITSGSTVAAASIIQMSSYWNDFAAYCNDPSSNIRAAIHGSGSDGKEEKSAVKPFLSANFIYATGSFTEMILALAVLGLPFASAKGRHDVAGTRVGKFTFKAASPAIMFHKEVRATEVVPSQMAIIQHYFDPLDARELKNGEAVDKYMTADFLPGTIYGCRVVLTNVASSSQRVEVLQQIPQGAIAIHYGGQRAFATRTVFESVEAFSTQVREFYFYFPIIGRYRHFPVHASKLQRVVGHGNPGELVVVTRRSTPVEVQTWRTTAAEGSDEQVLKYVREENTHKLVLSKIYWRCRSKEFYMAITTILRAKRLYDHTLWSYSLFHADDPSIAEYLSYSPLVSQVGQYFESTLLSYDAESYKDNTYQHLEYWPLVNARAHQLVASGGKSGSDGDQGGLKRTEIQNKQFKEQYMKYVMYMVYRHDSLTNMSATHRMMACYYFLIQERVAEARELFASIDSKLVHAEAKAQNEEAHAVLQYDYFTAFLDFSDDKSDSSRALQIAKQYKTYPVTKKRKMFEDIEQQIVEATPQVQPDVKVGDMEASRAKEMDALAHTEPSLDFAVESSRVHITYQNLSRVTVNYYVMDIELMFSTNPFIKDNDTSFLFVSPNHSVTVDLPAAQPSITVTIPDQFRNKNIYVELLAANGALSKCSSYYSHSLVTNVIDKYGQIKVTAKDNNRALPMVYVKVYARTNDGSGTVFWKDGYTDMRGRFDYASLSTRSVLSVEKFSVMVMSDDGGAVVREASPPKL